MDNFKAILEKQMKKVAASAAAPKTPAQPPLITPILSVNAATANQSEAHEPAVAIVGQPMPSEPLTPTAEVPLQNVEKRGGSNLNRVTVNLFAADRRALAVIKEYLSTTGNDFTSRSDSIKVALRFASKAKPEELARLYDQVKAEDRRFRG